MDELALIDIIKCHIIDRRQWFCKNILICKVLSPAVLFKT